MPSPGCCRWPCALRAIACSLVVRIARATHCEWHLDGYLRSKVNVTYSPWSFSIDESCTTLSCMTAVWGAIDDAGAAALAQTLKRSPQLEGLALGYNHIGDAGVASLAEALAHLPRLRTLHLKAM